MLTTTRSSINTIIIAQLQLLRHNYQDWAATAYQQ